MASKLRNNVSTTLAAGVAPADVTLTVPSGKGALWDDCFPPDYAYTTIMDAAGTIVEVVKVTSRSGDTLAIDRAQDGTTAQTWNTGAIVERRLNAAAVLVSAVDYILGANNTFSGNGTHNGLEVFNAKTTITTTAKIQQVLEKITITGSSPGAAPNFDCLTQAIHYYTTNAAANFAPNIRGDGSSSLNSIMATGESITITLILAMGTTAYYQTAMNIDGSAVTPKWINGAPSAGFASALNIYNYTIIKTGSAAFTVIASLAKAT